MKPPTSSPFPSFFPKLFALASRLFSGTPPTRAQTSLLFLTGPSPTAASRPRDFLSGGTGRPVPCPEKSLNRANFCQWRPLPTYPSLDPTPFSFYRFRAVLRNLPPLCYPPTQPIPNIFDGSKMSPAWAFTFIGPHPPYSGFCEFSDFLPPRCRRLNWGCCRRPWPRLRLGAEINAAASLDLRFSKGPFPKGMWRFSEPVVFSKGNPEKLA